MGKRSSEYSSNVDEHLLSRYSHIVFILTSFGGFFLGVLFIFDPRTSLNLISVYSHIPVEMMTESQSVTTHALYFVTRLAGTLICGLSLLTTAIAHYAYRTNHRWAWWAFLYWPVLFLSHYFLFSKESIMSPVQLLLVALTLGALLFKYPNTFKKKHKKKKKAPSLAV